MINVFNKNKINIEYLDVPFLVQVDDKNFLVVIEEIFSDEDMYFGIDLEYGRLECKFKSIKEVLDHLHNSEVKIYRDFNIELDKCWYRDNDID